jgi:hypothetical protein
MAAAVPVIGSIITSVLVSKAVSVIGEKIGLSDNLTSILGTVAAAYAGGTVFNELSAAQKGAQGMTAAGSEMGSGAGATPTPAAPSADVAASNVPSFDPSSAAPQDIVGAPRGGMLSEPAITPSMSTKPPITTAKPPTTTVPGTPASTQQSWTERLFSPEKTMDLVMAGMQGIGQAGIRETEMEYPEKIAQQNADAWAKAYPKPLSLEGFKPPSQQTNEGG